MIKPTCQVIFSKIAKNGVENSSCEITNITKEVAMSRGIDDGWLVIVSPFQK